MLFETWLAYAAACMIVCIIPGPTVLLTLSYALTQGRRVALATVAGVALGDLVAITATLLGLGAVMVASATAFQILKWLGAAYLIYIGIGLLRSKPILRMDEGTQSIAPSKVLRHAFMVTVLNPKGIGFFVAFVPQFIDPNGAAIIQFPILILTFVVVGGINALFYALAADKMRDAIRRPSVMIWLNRIGGSVMIAMGVMTATLKRG